jgi:transposase
MSAAFRWFVGIDWASSAHEVCILDAAGQLVERLSVPHSGAGLKKLADRLAALSQDRPQTVAVAIEVPHGAVVETLLERDFAVHSLNPKQVDRFRDRFSPAGAKDDRRDALVLASALRTDGQHFRRLAIQPAQIIRLRELVRMDEELNRDLRRLANQLYAQLQRFYPQVLSLSPAADEPWVWELLRRAPTPERGRRLPETTLSQILRQYRIRRLTGAQVHQALSANPLVVAPGTAEAASEHIQLLLARLELVHDQLKLTSRRTEALLTELSDAPEPRGREHRDVDILQSMPGIGRKISATMLAQAAEAIGQADYHALRVRAGLAPVTVASGKMHRVHMRRACDERLSGAMHHLAGIAAIHDSAAKAHYRRLRAAGHSHNRALRGVADRLLRILCAMLRDGTLYDPNRSGRAASVAALAA